jgi:uncharacterized protein
MRSRLSDEQCLSLHLALLQDAILKMASLAAGRFLYLAGSGFLPFDPEIPIRMQHGNDLGERMRNAFEEMLRSFDRVVIIGTDSPTFPASTIENAFEALRANDVVLGPAEDGGYYLIGSRFVIPEMFKEIAWGSANVLKQTRAVLSKYSVCLLPYCFDVDTPKDLDRLYSEIQSIDFAPHCKEWFNRQDARR